MTRWKAIVTMTMSIDKKEVLYFMSKGGAGQATPGKMSGCSFFLPSTHGYVHIFCELR
jgi:hypothetical protein